MTQAGEVPISPAVRELIGQLANDPACKSVWLFGSRANHSATEDSDWDLLVFDALELSEKALPPAGIDILRVAPSGQALLDGHPPEILTQDFRSWGWQEVSPRLAVYQARTWSPENDEDEEGFTVPQVPVFSTRQALLLWSAGHGFVIDQSAKEA